MGRNSRFRRSRRGTGSGVLSLFIALILAVAVGYTGTKYLVYPLLLQGKSLDNVQETVKPVEITEPIDTIKTEGTGNVEATSEVAIVPNPTTGLPQEVISDGQNIQEKVSGYALQYGIFSDKATATERVKELSQKGINVYVFETNTEFKVMGNAYQSKEKAANASDILQKGGVDVEVVDY